MSRQEQIAIILQSAVKDVRDEMDEFMAMDRDGDDYDLLDAFEDAAQKFEAKDASAVCRINVRRIQIALGWYREVTPEQLDRIIVSGGGKKYDFKLGGKMYVWAGNNY